MGGTRLQHACWSCGCMQTLRLTLHGTRTARARMPLLHAGMGRARGQSTVQHTQCAAWHGVLAAKNLTCR